MGGSVGPPTDDIGGCKLPVPPGSGGAVGFGGLFSIKFGKVPVKPEGRVDPSKELVDVGSKGEGYSGKFGADTFVGSVDKGGLKVGYCNEEGIVSPCGGRGSDCWCNCGGG